MLWAAWSRVCAGSGMPGTDGVSAEHQLMEIDRAQDGFAVHDDPTYANPQSQEWQAFVVQTACGWVSG